MAPRSRGRGNGSSNGVERKQDASPAGHKSVAREAYRFLANLSTGIFVIDGKAKRAIVQRIASGDMGTRFQRLPVAASAFDMVQLPGRRVSKGELTAKMIQEMPPERFRRMRLIEVKATRGPMEKSLRGLFFSFQYPEQLAAQTLGDHYRIIFVVINKKAVESFHRVISWSRMWSMARYIHVQFSIQF